MNTVPMQIKSQNNSSFHISALFVIINVLCKESKNGDKERKKKRNWKI